MTNTKSHPMISLARTACGTVLAIALAGCHGSSSDSSSSPAVSAAKPNYTIIRAAHVPTSALVTTAGQLQIVDVTDNKVLLKKTKVLPNTLVTANPTGISLNTTVVTDERIDRHHTVEFRLFQ